MAYEFNHVHLKAPDPGKTAEWYVKAFNFKILSDNVRDVGDRFIRCQTADGTIVNITGARTGEKLEGSTSNAHWGLEHIGIAVDDLDAEIQRLVGLGAELKEGPIDIPNGPRLAFLGIPDDTRIELLQLPK